jgi:membrane-associated phospholipid phosphatase
MLHRWSTWIAVVVFAVAVFAIDRVLGRYHWAEVAAHLYAIPSQTLLLAAALTVGSYLVLSLYDLLGVRNAGTATGTAADLRQLAREEGYLARPIRGANSRRLGIVSPGRTAMPRIIMDVTSLIAGSPRRILMRSPWLIGLLAMALCHVAGAAEPLSASQRQVEKAGTALRLAIPTSALLATFLLDPVKDPGGEDAGVERGRFDLLHLGGSPRHDLGLALGRTWIATDVLKYAADATRPDGGSRSFPSGHASIAFAGAEFLRVQYGWKWAAPAYAAATFVAWSRVEARRHYTHDVIAGALIGILANHDLHEWHARAGQLSLVPAPIMFAGGSAPGVQLTLLVKKM